MVELLKKVISYIKLVLFVLFNGVLYSILLLILSVPFFLLDNFGSIGLIGFIPWFFIPSWFKKIL